MEGLVYYGNCPPQSNGIKTKQNPIRKDKNNQHEIKKDRAIHMQS